MEKLINYIDTFLKNYLNTIEHTELKDIIKYSLFPGGKRFRPLLLLAFLDDSNLDLSLGINQAIAIEMIHNYSLIHDDLPSMDNDDYRRDKLTVHKKYGEAKAILAGDALLSDSFKFMTKGNINSEQKIQIIALASKNIGSNGMVLGQILDIDSNNKLSLKDLEIIQYHKTRDLIHLAIYSAFIISNLDEKYSSQINELANLIGLAFQIKDDLDDYKKNSSDLTLEKATYPSLIGTIETNELLKNYKAKSLEIINNILGKKKFYKLIEEVL